MVPSDFKRLCAMETIRLIFPVGGQPPADLVVSRFMAKAALESMAARIAMHREGLDYLCDETQLDPIRNHARRGKILKWPVHTRRIYAANAKTVGLEGRYKQVVHESDILVTKLSEWFFVLAIFGLEFAINIGGPDVEGYEKWLKENGGASPLYVGKNIGTYPMPMESG